MRIPQPGGGIVLREREGESVVELWGEIDISLRAEAGEVMSDAVERGLPVVLDTRKVAFMDSTGIAFLVQFVTLGRERGFSVALPDPPAAVVDVLEIVGVQGLFATGPRVIRRQSA
ncbi:STAS domain-containing protein [Paraoerskovia marina]|uniref:STAS domain-containing protein n=1 Tax=Paraoerskovia marina TaxID=545619 RepID=UPI000492D63F|nr:STAS domain-containing protein [Paraoerskovia marina]